MIEQRTGLKILWMILISRTVFAFLAQGIFALITQVTNSPMTYLEAGKWWTVYGTLIDLGCFFLLKSALNKEGMTIGQVIGFSRDKLKKDLKQTLIILVILLPITIAWGAGISTLLYGKPTATMIAGPLPLWAALYSVCIWPIGWAIMEQITYIGFSLPRLETFFKNKAVPVAIVMFFWALQHIALPVTLDLDYSLYRFLTVIPMVIIPLVFLKIRRLFPLILVHALSDVMSSVSFYFLPTH